MTIGRYIAEQFGKPVGIGGRIATWLMNIGNRRMYLKCRDIVLEAAAEKVLDVGFGNGYMLNMLRKQRKNIQLYGIDISEDACRMATGRPGREAELRVGCIGDLKFEDACFDVIYTINTIYFWSDIEKVLEKIERILVPGGLFINFCYTKECLDKLNCTRYGFNKMSCQQMLRLHSDVGFSTVELADIRKGRSFYIICRK